MDQKRKRGDRKDGRLLRELDPMHFITAIIYPNRADNEAFISERVDLTNLQAYLDKKNAGSPEFKYTMFQVITVAVLKTVMLRPKLNRFIVNGDTFERFDISAAFVVKKLFADNGGEGLAVVRAKQEDTIDSIHDYIYKQVSTQRAAGEGEGDSTDAAMDMLYKLPRFIGKTAVRFIMWLDKHGWVPNDMIASDPYYQSVVLTNLGSIKLHSGYHHLTNWGTNSLFVIVGERKKRPFWKEDGSFDMKDSIDLGLTVDERIADGYYFSKSVKLLIKLLEDPELLEKPLSEEVEY